MSECVVRMEMPRCCDECPMEYDGFMCAAIHKRFYPKKDGRYLEPLIDPAEQRLPDCPIICAMPDKHGRLVDADEIVKRICSDCAMLIDAMCDGGRTSCYPASFVYEQETIVPATEGGKHDHR